jgi:hypothetical protein
VIVLTHKITLRDLKLLAKGPGAASLMLDWLVADDAPERVRIIQAMIDFAASEFTKSADKKQGLNEDQLTQNIIEILMTAGIDAYHDVQAGGHCDIFVQASGNFMWLAEAKIHGAYGWLEKGYFQIATRYSSGIQGQDHGELIVYVFNKDCAAVFDEWLAFLTKNHPAVEQVSVDRSVLTFVTRQAHVKSGLPYHVRHKFFVLHFAPQD